jgi:addiction module RelE/StbE family toxin
MQVRWTTAAASDLENIADYLFEKTPENAARLIREICDAVFALRIYPNRGRPGKKSGTRELVLPALPYIVVYKVGSDVLHVARILHGAQDRPR